LRLHNFLKMEISEILEEQDNFLTNRKEIKIIVKAEKNPSFEEASNLLQEKYKTEKDLIVIRQIKGKFGRNTFLISAFIYKSKEDKEKFELKKKQEKKKEEQAQATQQAQPEQKTEEKPAEEKEEKKEE